MKCPCCRVPMMVVEYDGVELDYCVECEGSWFDRGELYLLLADLDSDTTGFLRPEQIEALPDARTDEKKRPCPICRKKMRKVNIGPEDRVLIDACSHGHGLWFDGTEVKQLAQNLVGTAENISDRALAFMGRMFDKDSASQTTEEDNS